MPFVKRKTHPVKISEVELGTYHTFKDELEFVTNHTMCHVISQLSNLSRFASDMFEDLTSEVIHIRDRGEKLRNHVKMLQEKYKSFNMKTAGDIFEENQEKEIVQHFDQQILRPNTRPVAITEIYKTANQPPALYKINPFRDDGIDALTFYTDPNFFFKKWSLEMQQTEPKHKRTFGRVKRHKHGKGPRQIKRKKDILQDRNAGLGSECDSTEQNEKTHNTHKERKLDELSNTQYEKKEKNNRKSDVEKVTTPNQAKVNSREHDTNNKETDVPPSVQMHRGEEPEIPRTVPMRKQAKTKIHRHMMPLPPPPPPPIVVGIKDIRNEEIDLLPPPPPILNDDASPEKISYVPNSRFLYPHIPDQRTSKRSLKGNRISSFIRTPLSASAHSRIYTHSFHNNDMGETPELNNINIAAPPVMPPPAPILPPVVASSSVVPSDSGMSERKTHTRRLLFDGSSLLEMKKKLVSSQKRTLREIQPNKSDLIDVHSIMVEALEKRNKVIQICSSSDEDTSDSNSEWE